MYECILQNNLVFQKPFKDGKIIPSLGIFKIWSKTLPLNSPLHASKKITCSFGLSSLPYSITPKTREATVMNDKHPQDRHVRDIYLILL